MKIKKCSVGGRGGGRSLPAHATFKKCVPWTIILNPSVHKRSGGPETGTRKGTCRRSQDPRVSCCRLIYSPWFSCVSLGYIPWGSGGSSGSG